MSVLAKHAREVVPHVPGVTGPAQSARDFAMTWCKLQNRPVALERRLQIQEPREVGDPCVPPPGRFRPAVVMRWYLLLGPPPLSPKQRFRIRSMPVASSHTPPEHRRNGYATASVTVLSRAQLAQGRAFCWVYTEPSAVGRGLLSRIGYRHVTDVEEYRFQSG